MRLAGKMIGKQVQVYSVEGGLFVGELLDAEGQAVLLAPGARRVWKWTGAATRSELANHGPSGGKMPAPMAGETLVLGVCEINVLTPEAVQAYAEIPVWSARD